MIRVLRAILIAMAMSALAMVVWIVTPSSMFFAPVSLSLDGDKLTMVRDTPFGDVAVEWVGEITLIDRDGFECSGSGHRIAQVADNGVVTGTIGRWASACIEEGPPFVLRYRYQVWLLGVIPLRPTGISIKVEAAKAG